MAEKPERPKFALPEEDDTRPEPPRKRGGVSVLTVLGAVLIGLFLIALILPPLPTRNRPAYESTALGNLRTMNTALLTYFSTYDNGYPSNLGMLGSPRTPPSSCERADMLDPSLASADNVVEKSGYRIEYRPGPPVEEAGEDCETRGVQSYVLVARPIRYGKTGRRSFRTDETILITFTHEGREATAEDPPL